MFSKYGVLPQRSFSNPSRVRRHHLYFVIALAWAKQRAVSILRMKILKGKNADGPEFVLACVAADEPMKTANLCVAESADKMSLERFLWRRSFGWLDVVESHYLVRPILFSGGRTALSIMASDAVCLGHEDSLKTHGTRNRNSLIVEYLRFREKK